MQNDRRWPGGAGFDNGYQLDGSPSSSATEIASARKRSGQASSSTLIAHDLALADPRPEVIWNDASEVNGAVAATGMDQ
jgi:hypothetical protein